MLRSRAACKKLACLASHSSIIVATGKRCRSWMPGRRLLFRSWLSCSARRCRSPA